MHGAGTKNNKHILHERLTATKSWLLKRSERLTNSCFLKYRSTEVNLWKRKNHFENSPGKKHVYWSEVPRGKAWFKRKTGFTTQLISDDNTDQNGLMFCLFWNETKFKVFTRGKFHFHFLILSVRDWTPVRECVENLLYISHTVHDGLVCLSNAKFWRNSILCSREISLKRPWIATRTFAWTLNWTTAKRESDLLITSMITDWIGQHEVLLPINHKNYSFREKEKQSLKYWQRRHTHSKGYWQKHKSKHAHAHVITTLNVIGWFKLHLWMWLAY